jgi:hypothetical protein
MDMESIIVVALASTVHRMTRATVDLIALLQGFGGIVLLDDIKAPKWPLMKQFWQPGVPSTVAKIDLTSFSHSRATQCDGRDDS